MATIKFRIRGKKNPANILVRVIDGRNCDIETATNLMINIEDWNPEKQKPKNTRGKEHKNLEIKLQEIKTLLLHHYNNSDSEKNKTWLEKFFNNNEIPSNLIDYISWYLDFREHELNNNTVKKINVIKNKLKKANLNTPIINVDSSFKEKFETWSRNNGYNSNTTANNLSNIKTIIKHAEKQGLKISTQIDEIKRKEKTATFVYLSFEELNRIKETNFNDENLSIAKDWLLISAFTAQRISDFMRFSAEMIKEYDGQKVIEFTQEKTRKTIALPLHKEVIEVLDKRKGEFPPRQLDQKYNKYIKTVCRESGIIEQVEGGRSEVTDKGIRKVFGKFEKCELVSSHIGRRSFATNFYGKIPTPLLMVATGHATEKMFLSYIGKSDKDKALELAKWF